MHQHFEFRIKKGIVMNKHTYVDIIIIQKPEYDRC